MTTLSDLIGAPSKEKVLDGMLAIARLAGFPTSSWDSGSLPNTLYNAEAATLADLAASIFAIAKGAALDSAEAGWLDLYAENLFQEKRKAATFTRHTLRLAAGVAAGPYTVPATFWVANADKSLRFVASDFPNGNTLPLGGSLEIVVQAESPGAAFNLTPGTIVAQITPLAGVAVTNPGGASGSSIVQQGTDQELDAAYRQRARDKWATLGSGSNVEAYRYWATSASSEVTRVRVTADPETGIVRTIIAGPSGPVTTTAYDAVAAVLVAKKPLGIKAETVNAIPLQLPVAATLHLSPGTVASAAVAAAQASVDAYARTTELGGSVYRSRIVAALQVEGVRSVDVDPLAPLDDVALPADHVFVPFYALTAVAS